MPVAIAELIEGKTYEAPSGLRRTITMLVRRDGGVPYDVQYKSHRGTNGCLAVTFARWAGKIVS